MTDGIHVSSLTKQKKLCGEIRFLKFLIVDRDCSPLLNWHISKLNLFNKIKNSNLKMNFEIDIDE